jgi:uncharacterized tellurite resistance protein B-like protein
MAYIIGAIVLFWGLKFFFGQQQQSGTSAGNPSQPGPTRPNKAEEMLEAVASTMTVGVYCALGDGNLDNRETATLRRWKDEFLKKVPSEAATLIGKAMEAEMQRSLRGVSEDRLHQACLKQKSLPEDLRAMTMGLAFEIVAADKKVESSELACLQKVARLLAIPEETFKRLEDKYLKPIQVAAATSGQTSANEQERILGIDSSWTKERKLAQLTSEFAKYNARMQTARDDTMRAQCRKMLEIIADMREELITGRKPNRNPPPQPKPTANNVPRPTTPSTPRPAPTIPAPVGSKDEILIGVDLNLPPRQKLAFLDGEEARWKGRKVNHLPPAALAKCETALQAIRRLRNVYQAQL